MHVMVGCGGCVVLTSKVGHLRVGGKLRIDLSLERRIRHDRTEALLAALLDDDLAVVPAAPVASALSVSALAHEWLCPALRMS